MDGPTMTALLGLFPIDQWSLINLASGKVIDALVYDEGISYDSTNGWLLLKRRRQNGGTANDLQQHFVPIGMIESVVMKYPSDLSNSTDDGNTNPLAPYNY